VRMMVRLIAFPTRETNSSHTSSSEWLAHKQTTSFRDKDEYRVGLGMLNILLFPAKIVGANSFGYTTMNSILVSADRSWKLTTQQSEMSVALLFECFGSG